ncbi:hypothetical protein BDV93DRAFT_301358 [Ceratobasidium sp. AG-I]|nr:hypothetical protein BDV93DRAFT_301358 [Ceratobasidium sp. AG-I]
MYECVLPNISRSLFKRILRRQPYASQVRAAYHFIVENYRSGDFVMLFGWMWDDKLGDPRYVALRQLAKAIDKGLLGERIPIKCVCIGLQLHKNLQWPGFGQVLSHFPFTVENIFCLSDHAAYAAQRGLEGKVKRKEIWLSDHGFCERQVMWMVALQTSHIIDYDLDDLQTSRIMYWVGDSRILHPPQLLESAVQLNCTKRRKGQPCDDAILTGGQLTRVSKIRWPVVFGRRRESLVWSSQSFAEGGYDAVCSTSLVGPQSADQGDSVINWLADLEN